MSVWYISVRNHTSSKKFRIHSNEGEAILDTYRRVKALAEDIKRRLSGQTVTVDVISGTRAFGPPQGFTRRKGHLWCPYCRTNRMFMPTDTVKKCIICGVSDQDFHVKKYNGIFAKEYEEYLVNLKLDKERKR